MSKENKNRFQILAHTDSLTDIYNRYGFDEAAEKIIAQNPKTHFVAALFDIDDFKFINDVYGHAYGDRALKSLADNMKAFFSTRCTAWKKRWWRVLYSSAWLYLWRGRRKAESIHQTA